MSPVPVKIAAVLFDLDGVLVDSEPVHAAAYEQLFAEQGVEFGPEQFRKRGRGVSRREVIMTVLGPTLDPGRLAALMERKAELVTMTLARDGLPTVPGAAELVVDLRGASIATAVVSVSDMVVEFLRAARIDASFDTIVGRADCERTKPHPDPYVLAATRLGVDPRACVVIEDSAVGVASALAAGATVVGLARDGADAGGLSDAHIVCEDYDDVRRHLRL